MAVSQQDAEAVRNLRLLNRSERVEELFGFSPFGYQAAIMDCPSPDVSVNCGRQVGKTETGGAIGADAALSYEDIDIAFFARWQDTANEMFRRAKQHLRNSRFSLDRLGVTKDNETEWEFDTGTRMYSKTLKAAGEDGDNQRGKLPKVVLVDEAALVDDSTYEKVIEPMFATHGDDHELYLMSTPRGKSGYHYRKHTLDDDWASFHVDTAQNPLVDNDWLAKRRAKVDDITWRQEYLGEFVDEGETYLPSTLVMPCVDETDTLPVAGQKSGPRFLGVDIARQGRDRTVYYGMEEDGGCYLLESEQTSKMPSVAGRIRSFVTEYDIDLVLIDENAVGGGVVDLLSDMGARLKPVKFTLKSKQNLYQSLKTAFEKQEITIPNHDRLIHETTRLEFEFTQSGKLKVHHPPGGRDDHPDALALGNFGRMQAAPRRTPDPDDSGVSFL